MDFNVSPLNRLVRKLLKCRNIITTIFVFSFVMVLLQHSVVVLKLFTSKIIVTTKLNFSRQCFLNLSSTLSSSCLDNST